MQYSVTHCCAVPNTYLQCSILWHTAVLSHTHISNAVFCDTNLYVQYSAMPSSTTTHKSIKCSAILNKYVYTIQSNANQHKHVSTIQHKRI